MRNRELIAHEVKEATGLSPFASVGAVNAVLHQIGKSLADGERIYIRNFGTFSTRKKNKRLGRNPKNGDIHEIRAKTVARFRAYDHLRDRTDGAV